MVAVETPGRAGLSLSPESLHAICDLSHLKYLGLIGVHFPDNHSHEFGRLKALEMLHIHASNVSDRDLAAICHNKNLTFLTLSKSDISDAGLELIAELPRLKQLNISETKVTDAGLAHLRALTELKQLDVQHTAVTDQGVATLKLYLPKLSIQTTEAGASAPRGDRPANEPASRATAGRC